MQRGQFDADDHDREKAVELQQALRRGQSESRRQAEDRHDIGEAGQQAESCRVV